MIFYTGLHQPSDAWHFNNCMVSISRLRGRKSNFQVNNWILDSGAFSEIRTHGDFRTSCKQYADEIIRWKECGRLAAAVTQDYMCEDVMLKRTGLSVVEHQRLTIERYDEINSLLEGRQYLMPVLQGYYPYEYVSHIIKYGDRLSEGQWVGVGSVCKRNAKPEQIIEVLQAIKAERPDLRLHGFGLKKTALANPVVMSLLESADSMAWSFNERAQRTGRQNTWQRAYLYACRITDGNSP